MTDKEFTQNEKRIPHKRKFKSHTYIKDNDLQIHIPTIKDANCSHKCPNFKSFSSFVDRMEIDESSIHLSQQEDLNLAMEEAKCAFDSMMLIREQLHQAYQDFMQMQD